MPSAGLLLPLEVSGWLALPVDPTKAEAPAEWQVYLQRHGEA